MVIAVVRGYPVEPHRQVDARKTYCIIEGELLVRFYSANGKQIGEAFINRAGMPVLTFPSTDWHSCEATTEIAVFLEIQPGPYDPSRTEWL
jgi:cupin fold WbuC family metalloprotein